MSGRSAWIIVAIAFWLTEGVAGAAEEEPRYVGAKKCKTCHGPGSLYRKKKIMSDREKALAAGMWEADKDDKICAACHNEDSPVVPEEGFDFAKLREGIQHPIPEDVKGRYLEIEKQLKAERQAGGEAVEEEA